MSSSWREDEEDFRQGAGKGVALRSKPRFSFHEVKVLLEAVKRNRYVLLKKFNHGVSVEAKKRAWIEITNQINDLGENHREVRQIMKKWADLTCDGRRRLMSLRKPHTGYIRKKTMGPVERVVHKLLLLSPSGNGDSDFEMFDDEDFSKGYSGTPPPNPSPHSYLSLTDSSHSVPDRFSYDMSPLSSPEEDAGGDPFQSSSEFDIDLADEGEQSLDFEDNYESLFSSYPSSLPPSASLDQDQAADSQLRVKPVHTYSRNSSQNNNNNYVQNHTSSKPPPGVSDSDAGSSSAAPSTSNMAASSSSPFIPPLPPSSSSVTPNGSTSQPTASSSSVPQPPPSSAASSTNSSNSHRPSPASSSSSSSAPPSNQSPVPNSSCDPLPAGASSRRAQDHVAQMASQSLQQQRASRMLLASVSQSLEVLAQSVQLLVESQQEFVQESLQLQRETVDILRDFSSTALTMLRDKANSGQVPRHLHHPASHY